MERSVRRFCTRRLRHSRVLAVELLVTGDFNRDGRPSIGLPILELILVCGVREPDWINFRCSCLRRRYSPHPQL